MNIKKIANIIIQFTINRLLTTGFETLKRDVNRITMTKKIMN